METIPITYQMMYTNLLQNKDESSRENYEPRDGFVLNVTNKIKLVRCFILHLRTYYFVKTEKRVVFFSCRAFNTFTFERSSTI